MRISLGAFLLAILTIVCMDLSVHAILTIVALLSQEWVKLRTSNFVRTFIGAIRTKAH